MSSGSSFTRRSGMRKIAGQQRLERVDVAADGRVVDAEEEAEEGVGGVGPVVDQEHQQAVGQGQGVLAPGPGLALPPRSVLAAGLGLLVAGRQVGQQAVEGGRGDPRQQAEGFRGSLQALGVGHGASLPTRGPIVQRL